MRQVLIQIVLLSAVFCQSAFAENPIMQVQLPFYDGKAYRCTQNSDDTPTHQSTSTKYDLDFRMEVGDIVVAAANGTMYWGSNPNGFGTYAKVDHGNGYWTMYGHLSGYIASNGSTVSAGQPIAYSGNTGNVYPVPSKDNPTGGQHIHFGVHSGSGVGESRSMDVYVMDQNTDELGWFSTGIRSESDFMCDESDSVRNGHRYESRPIGKIFSDYSCKALTSGGVLCWNGNPTTCEDGQSHTWFHKNNEGANVSDSNSNTWKKCLQDSGQNINIFSYLDGGYGVGGVGPGSWTNVTDSPIPNLPDFITKKVWLETPWGTETYKYGRQEIVKMKAQFENIGDGSCSGDIEVHFYRSGGYKEDSSTERKRVGTDFIHCDNLKPGDTHTETEGIELWRDIPETGIWNITAYIDHIKDDHNNGGAHPEKHESNNGSTEAVFEVTADAYVNVPNTDLIVSAIQVKGGTTQLPAGGITNLQMAIRNIGTVTPTAGIRSNYSFCGPSPSSVCVQVADDGSEAGELTSGRDQWEETLAPIPVPATAGGYLLKGCADYQNAVLETNETNNCSTRIVQVVMPSPDLIVSALGLREGTSIKAGTRVHPWCTVMNIGGPSPAAMRLAYYINWNVYRDSDAVEAYELCAGCSKKEEVLNNNIKLGDKGTRTYRCCVDYQGAVAESNESNNCATMSFKVR